MKKAVVSIIILFSIICINKVIFAKYLIEDNIKINMTIDNKKPNYEITYSCHSPTYSPVEVILTFDKLVIDSSNEWTKISDYVFSKEFEENTEDTFLFLDEFGNFCQVPIIIDNIYHPFKIVDIYANVPKREENYYINQNNIVTIVLNKEEIFKIYGQSFLDNFKLSVYGSDNSYVISPQLTSKFDNDFIYICLTNIEVEGNLTIQIEDSMTMDIIAKFPTDIFVSNNLKISSYVLTPNELHIFSNNFIDNFDFLSFGYREAGSFIEVSKDEIDLSKNNYEYVVYILDEENNKLLDEEITFVDIYGNSKVFKVSIYYDYLLS